MNNKRFLRAQVRDCSRTGARSDRSGALGLLLTAMLLSCGSYGEQSAAGISMASPDEHRQSRTDAYGDPLPTGAVARMGTLRLWQGSSIRSIAFAPDGKTKATNSANYSDAIPLFEADTGR
jgi:hypothetical protein